MKLEFELSPLFCDSFRSDLVACRLVYEPKVTKIGNALDRFIFTRISVPSPARSFAPVFSVNTSGAEEYMNSFQWSAFQGFFQARALTDRSL